MLKILETLYQNQTVKVLVLIAENIEELQRITKKKIQRVSEQHKEN